MWSPAHGPRQLRRSARSKNNPGVHKAVCKHLRVCTLAAAMPHAHRPSTLGTGRDTKRTGQAMCEFGALTVQVVCLGMDGGSKQMRTGSWQRALADRGGLSLALTVAKVRVRSAPRFRLTHAHERQSAPRLRTLASCLPAGLRKPSVSMHLRSTAGAAPFPARARHRYL